MYVVTIMRRIIENEKESERERERMCYEREENNFYAFTSFERD